MIPITAQKEDLGADVVVDYPTQDFAQELSGYDLVIDSLGGLNLEKSLTVLKPGGLLIGVAGPPDAGFAKQLGAPAILGVLMTLLSRKVRKQAKALDARRHHRGWKVAASGQASAVLESEPASCAVWACIPIDASIIEVWSGASKAAQPRHACRQAARSELDGFARPGDVRGGVPSGSEAHCRRVPPYAGLLAGRQARHW